MAVDTGVPLMFSIFLGFALSLTVIIFAKFSGFDRDKSFYPTILIVIAAYYVLFAIISGHSVLRELLIALVFLVIAVFGAYKSLAIVGAGIAAHGGYDIFHVFYLSNNVAPIWWASFCATVDFVLGFWVIYLSKSRDLQVKKHTP